MIKVTYLKLMLNEKPHEQLLLTMMMLKGDRRWNSVGQCVPCSVLRT